MINPETLQKLVWAQFAKATEEWPEELRQSMRNIEIDIVKREGQIRVVARAIVDDASTDRAKEALLDQLIIPISRVIGAFQCKVNIFR